MAMLHPNPSRTALLVDERVDGPRAVDIRRLGLGTLDGRARRSPGLYAPLSVAALLAEADRALRPVRTPLLVLDVAADGTWVDVTLADGAARPLWMGALPTSVDVGGVPTGLPADRDGVTEARRRTLARAMAGVGFVPGTASWFRWVPPRTF